MSSRSVAVLIIVSGTALVVGSTLAGGDGSLGLLLFMAWGLVPYTVLGLATAFVKDPWIVGGAGTAALAVDIGIRLSVFVFPRGSTAALALIFSPVFIAAVCEPIGALGGYAIGRVARAFSAPVAAVAVLIGVAALALASLEIARPDLFPTAVLHRRSVLSRVGEARIVAGANAFERRALTDAPHWTQAGDFQNAGRDQIAIIDSRGIDLLDADDYGRRGHVTFPPNVHWTYSSRLVRLRGDLAVAEVGGGFQDTRVRTIDGTELWRYHPDRDLPPTSMLPADLDRNGAIEFYAATTSAIARLDDAGREMWRFAARMPAIVGLMPRSPTDTGWIAAIDQGREAIVIDDRGQRLGGWPLGDAAILGIVDWPKGRGVVIGGRDLRVVGLDGAVRFQWAVDDMSIVQACAFHPSAGRESFLALVAAAPRDVHRWRMQIVASDRRVVYDQVFAEPVQLFEAVRSDGGDTLVVNAGRVEALRALP